MRQHRSQGSVTKTKISIDSRVVLQGFDRLCFLISEMHYETTNHKFLDKQRGVGKLLMLCSYAKRNPKIKD